MNGYDMYVTRGQDKVPQARYYLLISLTLPKHNVSSVVTQI
jgi:hypothetical protein